MANHALELTGLRFGRLTVIGVAHRIGGVHWKCRCDCGSENVVRGSNLKSGKVKSCGCLARDAALRRSFDLTRLRFGNLTVTQMSDERLGHTKARAWDCVCDCGNKRVVSTNNLRRGVTTSCGCTYGNPRTTHGMSNTPEYGVWVSMRQRCSNPSDSRWHTHGGRGIRVCERWANSFENFINDMGWRPNPALSIERVDNDGDYTPDNCVWATDREQADNRRSTIRIEIYGKVQSLKAWCRELGIPYLRTWKRLIMRGWSLERALQP